METTTIVIIVVVLILLVVVGIVMTKPKSEVEVDTELAKDVAEAETELEEKTADLQAANEELAANPTEEKAVEVAKKAEEVKEAAAKVEEKKTEQAVETAKKIDCKVSEWGEYSQCEKVGDDWKKKKTRSILTQPSGGGVACPSDLEELIDCKPSIRPLKSYEVYNDFPTGKPFLIRNINKRVECLDDNNATKAGEFKMKLAKCDINSKNQLFTYDSDNKMIKSVNKPNLCIDDGGGTTSGATTFHLWDCDPNNKNQKFIYDNTNNVIKADTKSNLCVDDKAGKGELLHLWSCDGNNSNQRYSIYSPELKDNTSLVKGRYVSVGFVNGYKGTINIWQMDVFDKNNNLISQEKPVTGLNILPQFPGSKLVDNTRYTGDDNQLIHTAGTSPNEYVEIDLGAEYDISRIVVYNRTNGNWDRIKRARIIISTSPARVNPVYTSQELTDARFQWVYPPSTTVIGDNDAGYGDRPRGFYNIYGDENKKYVRCREVGDNPRFIACATEDDMYLKEYNGKSIKDILGDLYNSPSNFIRMFKRRQEVAKGDTF